MDSAEAAKLVDWAKTQWGSSLVPVKVTLDTYVSANKDPNWNNDTVIWVDLTGDASANLKLSDGTVLVLPVDYVD